jgi:NADPH2:quinone reductase
MPLIVNPSMGKNLSYRFILTYTSGAEEKSAAVAGVAHAVGAGALRVGEEHGLPLRYFELADTAAAHAAVEGAAVGKVLIRVAAN